MTSSLAVACVLAIVALVYATVGQAGGTAFLAVMAVVDVPLAELRPTALALNIVAAGYTTWRLQRAGAIDWRLLARIGGPSIPLALLGGLVALDARPYYILTGAVLLVAAVLMLFKSISTVRRQMSVSASIVSGGALGLLSGLTGVGGGVFLAPLLILGGWSTAKEAAALSAPFILANSMFGLAGATAAGQIVSSQFPLYAGATIVGATIGAAIGLILAERFIRYVLALVLGAAGLRLLFGSLAN